MRTPVRNPPVPVYAEFETHRAMIRDRVRTELDGLAEKTVNEILYSGAWRHLAEGDLRSEPAALWTTDARRISLEEARAPHEAEMTLRISSTGIANALALWFSSELVPGTTLSVAPGDPPTHWGMTTAPLREPVELEAGSFARARVRTAPARDLGTWTRWAVRFQGGAWEEHDEQSVWTDLED